MTLVINWFVGQYYLAVGGRNHWFFQARKEIEINYGLIKAEDQKNETVYLLQPAKLEAVEYGKTATKAAISGIVREVVSSYKFTSLPELNALLRQFNIAADRGEPGTKMYEKGGLVYSIINAQGEKTGVPIKASSIYSSPTLKNLEKKFSVNETVRKPYGQRLKHLLDKALAASKDMAALQAALHQQGIRIVLRQNAEGQVYGITFIDNATRTVFNGSDLGKAYSAKAFMEKLNGLAETGAGQSRENKQSHPGTMEEKVNQISHEHIRNSYPAQSHPVIETFVDIALSDEHDENLADPFKRKKKKRLQAE